MKIGIPIGERIQKLYEYRDEPENLHELAGISWLIVLCSVVAVVVCGVAYGMWELQIAISPSANNVTAPSAQRDLLDKVQLTTVLDGFTMRETQYRSLRNGSALFSDLR